MRGSYLVGGRNVMAAKYQHDPDYPPFPDRAAFLGELSGDWFEMGRQFGERSGEAVRYVSDIWWRDQCQAWGLDETRRALKLYEDQIEALDPGQVAFIKGVEAGAAAEMERSAYQSRRDPLESSAYERILVVNVQDEWTMRHPPRFPDGTSTYGGERTDPLRTGVEMCSGFSARGTATREGVTLAAQNRQCGYDPRCYEQAFVVRPDDGLACWVLSNCPQVAANQVVNEKGVSLALFAGGRTTPQSLGHPQGPLEGEAFGVPWFHLFLYVGTHASTAAEAIQMLTVGPEGYRSREGRSTLLRGGGWIFMVTDPNEMAVVEVTSDRYAVRRPGEHTGDDWTDEDFIVATNHNLCDHSYDADNRETDIPMSVFGDGYVGEGDAREPGGSRIRFWTLMWDLRHQFGEVDSLLAQRIVSGLYAYDAQSGEKLTTAQDEAGEWGVRGHIRPCSVGGRVSMTGGTADGKVAELRPGNGGGGAAVNWTLGSPCHWQGAWDRYEFD